MKIIKQLAIILTISFIAELMEELIPLPVAASMYGLVLMLIGLITKIIPLEKVETVADFLVEILPIMFIPPTVGIMASAQALKEMLVPLVVISIVSTILIMTVTGRTTQYILRMDERKKVSVKGMNMAATVEPVETEASKNSKGGTQS